MTETHKRSVDGLRIGAVLALIAILSGFVMGGAFGAAEDSIKDWLRSSAEAVTDTVYEGDAAKANAIVGRSWSYMKRAHLHCGAIGAAALAIIAALALMGGGGRVDRYSSIALGAGAILYGFFWFFAALKAPGLGSTGAAKEALNFLAIPGAGLCLAGICGALFSIARGPRPL